MKTIKGLMGYVGFGVSATISQGQQSLGPQIEEWENVAEEGRMPRSHCMACTLICAAETFAVMLRPG